jgi:AcrR family transcriptional regulator
VSAGADPSVGAVAAKAGVSRITVYNQFGSRSGLLEALAPRPDHADLVPGSSPRDQLQQRIAQACSFWAADTALYRHLPSTDREDLAEATRRLAESLAAADELRPGCSIKEAEDVIGALSSFALFERLHRDGRRSSTQVAEILMRLASGILT